MFIAWDEGSVGKTIPFFAGGWGGRPNHVSKVRYSNHSVLKTIERILGLLALDAVKETNDLSDMFGKGILPFG